MSQRTQKDVDLFWQKLEAERHDLTYRRPAEPANSPQIVVRTVRERVNREQRDKLLFNAGRYAAGARDKTATAAHQQLQAEQEKGN